MSGEAPKVNWDRIRAARESARATRTRVAEARVFWNWVTLSFGGVVVGLALSFAFIGEWWAAVGIACFTTFAVYINRDNKRFGKEIDKTYQEIDDNYVKAEGDLLIMEEVQRRVHGE